MRNPFAISPVDGRYGKTVDSLREFFSEWAFFRYRIRVEVEYLKALKSTPLKPPDPFPPDMLLNSLWLNFSEKDYKKIIDIEEKTRHDIKAVEIFIREQLEKHNYKHVAPYVHICLTSQDVNHLAIGLMIKDAFNEVLIPALRDLLDLLVRLSSEWLDIPMLSRTHGQPASPTLLGKEFAVWLMRLVWLVEQLVSLPIRVKFGGATGTFASWHILEPAFDWIKWADEFVASLGMQREICTTQISHYDGLSMIWNLWAQIATVLLDMCVDIWIYVMLGYFRLRKLSDEEIGSSTMPHKINPIQFETAEGNLQIARGILRVLAEEVPVSRLQRDLSDSTLVRNMGVSFAHILVAVSNIITGLKRLQPNEQKIRNELDEHQEVLAEPLQLFLRVKGDMEAYDKIRKQLQGYDRTPRHVIEDILGTYIGDHEVCQRLLSLTPAEYTGLAREEARIAIEYARRVLDKLR